MSALPLTKPIADPAAASHALALEILAGRFPYPDNHYFTHAEWSDCAQGHLDCPDNALADMMDAADKFETFGQSGANERWDGDFEGWLAGELPGPAYVERVTAGMFGSFR